MGQNFSQCLQWKPAVDMCLDSMWLSIVVYHFVLYSHSLQPYTPSSCLNIFDLMRSSNAEMIPRCICKNWKIIWVRPKTFPNSWLHQKNTTRFEADELVTNNLQQVFLMFIPKFMHFQSMSCGTNPATGQTLKATGADMFGLHVSPDCRFNGINIITGIATPVPALQTTNLFVNCFFNLVNIGQCLN